MHFLLKPLLFLRLLRCGTPLFRLLRLLFLGLLLHSLLLGLLLHSLLLCILLFGLFLLLPGLLLYVFFVLPGINFQLPLLLFLAVRLDLKGTKTLLERFLARRVQDAGERRRSTKARITRIIIREMDVDPINVEPKEW